MNMNLLNGNDIAVFMERFPAAATFLAAREVQNEHESLRRRVQMTHQASVEGDTARHRLHELELLVYGHDIAACRLTLLDAA